MLAWSSRALLNGCFRLHGASYDRSFNAPGDHRCRCRLALCPAGINGTTAGRSARNKVDGRATTPSHRTGTSRPEAHAEALAERFARGRLPQLRHRHSEAPQLRDGTTSPTSLSASDFGAESGTPRILKMLDHYEVPATFFMTAVDAMLHPDMLAAILKSGRHEVGVHGWIHEFPPRLAEGEEERLLDQAIAYLTKATGKRPVGYRAPSWAFSASTLDLIQKKGFVYDSSLQALDEPYEIVSRGKNTGLIELAIPPSTGR